MIKLEHDTGVLNKITRNDTVYVFYKRLNIFGFLSAYIIQKWFEKHDMMKNFNLIPVLNDRDMFEKSNSLNSDKGTMYVFLVDVDVSPLFLINFFTKNTNVLIFDNKKSTTSFTNKLPKAFAGKVKYFAKNNYNTLKLVFRTLYSDPYPNEFAALDDIKNIEEITSQLTDYHLCLPGLFGNSFKDVDEFFAMKKHLVTLERKDKTDAVCCMIEQATEIVYSGCDIYKLGEFNVGVINAPGRISRFIFPIVLSNMTADICVCYSILNGVYSYKIKTVKPSNNLMSIFSKFKPFGDPNFIWFTSSKKINDIFKK